MILTRPWVVYALPTAMVMALDDHGDRAGLASSLGGTLQMMAGALMIAITGPFFDGTPLPMLVAIALCAVIERTDGELEYWALNHPAPQPDFHHRDGFVLSDGAGAIMLEELEHAKARGATIYAELVGLGMSGDAFHMTSPPEGGRGAALCMRNALLSAELDARQIDYVNAHGTSTPVGDLCETHRPGIDPHQPHRQCC